jgi:hypothetical protein
LRVTRRRSRRETEQQHDGADRQHKVSRRLQDILDQRQQGVEPADVCIGSDASPA